VYGYKLRVFQQSLILSKGKIMKILLTGANGYIGRRLKQTLLNEDVSLRLLVRNPKSLDPDLEVEVAQGDTFDIPSLELALEGVDVAYYLIHSLQDKDYKNLDASGRHLLSLIQNY